MKSHPHPRTKWSRRFRKLCQRAVSFFGQVPGSLKRHLNTQELVRVILASVFTGGGIFGLLHSVFLSTGSIFPAPSDAALAATVLTVILESLRRLEHGNEVGPEAVRSRSAQSRP